MYLRYIYLCAQGARRAHIYGKSRWPGNVYVERFWRSLKQEEVYRHACEAIAEAEKGIAHYLCYVNQEHPRQGFDNRLPAT